MILSGITALVLLVACANFTNLMLARSERRRREFVIRLALGGGRWRLIRQLATECVVLAVVAGLLGLLFASWATAVTLKQFAVMIEPVEFALELDARVLAFAGGCVAMVIAFGLWPCTRPARSAAVSSVYQATSASGRARARVLAGRIMLVVQLAACTVLLIGAGLLLRTVTNLRSQELGFDRNVLLVSVSPGQAGYSEQAATMLLQRVRERLSAVPGIQAVGISGLDAARSHQLLDRPDQGVDHRPGRGGARRAMDVRRRGPRLLRGGRDVARGRADVRGPRRASASRRRRDQPVAGKHCSSRTRAPSAGGFA